MNVYYHRSATLKITINRQEFPRHLAGPDLAEVPRRLRYYLIEVYRSAGGFKWSWVYSRRSRYLEPLREFAVSLKAGAGLEDAIVELDRRLHRARSSVMLSRSRDGARRGLTRRFGSPAVRRARRARRKKADRAAVVARVKARRRARAAAWLAARREPDAVYAQGLRTARHGQDHAAA